ncbi:hypothetical protein ED733_002341 [Metarhizium rileyi]|uniref:Tat pathway signal sequence n=1 Tax=Metarhizium rileyi (strain RCEF 4871) TaxID=1649241 RepID=A0A5C6G435_METRR|nr:hypothetical protein ED733_002341 [Metarhizium rileyi]
MAPLSKSIARKHTVFLLALFSSLVISFALFTYFMLLPFSQFTTRHKPSNKSHVPADLLALEASVRPVRFAQHEAYRNLSHEHDRLWQDRLLPPNGGYLTLANGQNRTGRSAIAMFHQLHCLAMIRTEMQRLDDMRLGQTRTPTGSESWQRHRERALHCFDYLRQSLLCMADATIERPRQSSDNRSAVVDDDDMSERQCKDWDILYKASTRSDEEPVMPDDLR